MVGLEVGVTVPDSVGGAALGDTGVVLRRVLGATVPNKTGCSVAELTLGVAVIGAATGSIVGKPLGIGVGNFVGTVGMNVGELLGVKVGRGEFKALGNIVGPILGDGVENTLGKAVDNTFGVLVVDTTVGNALGITVGKADDSKLGDTVSAVGATGGRAAGDSVDNAVGP